MRSLIVATATLALVAFAAISTNVAADPRDDQRGGQQSDQNRSGWGQDYNGGHHWRRGQRIGYNDWNGAQTVDYRQHHLRQPPRGYEWRESNGQYVLAAIATGVIASIILSGGR
ncbi:MAG: RcnB family protein [Caulobacterales bacterium]